MAVDTSSVAYFLPIIAFVLVLVIVYAVFAKLKLFGDNNWPNALIAFFVATIFITVAGSVEYIRYVVGWMAILFVSMAFILAIIGMFGDGLKDTSKGFGIAFLVIAVIIFLISATVVYSSYITPFLPGGSDVGSNGSIGQFTGWLYSSKVLGAVLLLVVGGFAAWILTKSGK